MNVAFLTLSNINDINDRGIYNDLFRHFRNEGHNVYIIKPFERRQERKTELFDSEGVKILGVRTLNIQKTNIVEKGLGTVMLEGQFKRAIKKYLKGVSFDIILFSTPPITLVGAVKYLKKRNSKAMTYLLLKDIFPQNAVDIEMMREGGLLHRYFRSKEIALYQASDYIGCMSPANVEFVVKHNPFVDAVRVEVAPNSIELSGDPLPAEDVRKAIRFKYGLPVDKPIFIYGGNLGKPQGIPFLIECLEANRGREDCHFVVVGGGTEYGKLKAWCDGARPKSVTLLNSLPKADYDILVRCCDVGLIFLDHRFLIPNYPSRLLSYLENKMPIIAATDVNSDIGSIAEQNGYGYWCESNIVEAFNEAVDKMLESDRKGMGLKGYRFLCENYLVEHTYRTIVSHLDVGRS